MARRRASAAPDTPERLAAAIAWQRSAVARLAALRAGRPLPAAAPPPPQSAAHPACSASPEQTYRNTERLLGEGNDQ